MVLKNIIDEIRNYPGITRKRNIHRAVEILRGIEADAFCFLVSNFGAPPKVRVIFLDQEDDYIGWARGLARTTVRLIGECKEAGNFPDFQVPFQTQSMAKYLGIKSDIATQLLITTGAIVIIEVWLKAIYRKTKAWLDNIEPVY